MVQDIADKHFWDRIPFLKPYAMLARWDRPIGFWLLYWPCIWSLALAPHFKTLDFIHQMKYVLLFLIGAIAMRGAGCTLNDLYDRKLDAQVTRTKNRPLASGALKPWQALIFCALQLLAGAAVLLQFSATAILIGLVMLPLIATYPLMKRITWWPQFFLGLNFASGALVGWAAIENSLSLIPCLLYAAGIAWVVAYDTVYAHMDSADDALIGIKSTALRWGPNSKLYTGILWVVTFTLFGAVLALSHAHWISYATLALAVTLEFIAHSFWNPENEAYALRFFRLQHPIGWLLAMAALAPVVFS
jgi:4-hydroxybenzoate polyprenyltransferase